MYNDLWKQVPDTESTFLNFDGITYGKGASVLKQLVFTLGEESFKRGMRIYFSRHGYANTELSDFLQALQDGQAQQSLATAEPASVDLNIFSEEWLQQAGLNSLSPEYALDTHGEKIASFDVVQSAVDGNHPRLRTHHLQVALYRADGTLFDVVKSKISGEKTRIDALAGKPAPQLCFINHNDHAYAKITLDPASLAFTKAHLDVFVDPLTRQLLYRCLWDMVRDSKMSSIDYIDLAIRFLPTEPDTDLLSSVLSNLRGAISRFVPKKIIASQALKLFEMTRVQVEKTKGKGDAGITWARLLCHLGGRNESTIKILVGMLKNEKTNGIVFDQDMKWGITTSAVAWALPEAQALLAEQTAVDGKTDRGARSIAACEAAAPDAEVKSRLWQGYLRKSESRSLHMTAASMGGFFCPGRDDTLFEAYHLKFFDVVTQVFKDNEREYSQNYFAYLYPSTNTTTEIASATEKLLASIDEKKEPMFHRTVREALDDLHRATRCRQFAEKSQ